MTRKIYRLDAMGYLHNAVHDLFVVPAAGGEARNLTRDENHNCRYTAPEWSPDSQEILFTTTFFPDEYRFFAALRVANLNGEVRDLVREWGYASYSAVWSPDGASVIFVGNRIEAPFSAQNHLWVVDSKGGTPRLPHNRVGRQCRRPPAGRYAGRLPRLPEIPGCRRWAERLCAHSGWRQNAGVSGSLCKVTSIVKWWWAATAPVTPSACMTAAC